MLRLSVPIATVVTALAPLCAQAPLSPTLLKDLNDSPNPVTRPSDPALLATTGGLVYMSVNAGNGFELWASDGTVAGTGEVADINAGTAPSSPSLGAVPPSGRVVFRADSGQAYGSELFVTGPGISGAQILKDINPGPASSFPKAVVAWKGEVWFLADDGVSGIELWRTDGTETGTVLAEELAPGVASGFGVSDRLLAGDNVLYMVTTTSGTEVRVKTGPSLASTLVTAIDPQVSIEGYSVLGDQMLFNQWSASEGVELWSTDGTPGGTTLLLDIFAGANGSFPRHQLTSSGRLWFTAGTATEGVEPWVSDGTPGGTFLLNNIGVGPGSGGANGFATTSLGLVFSANDGSGFEPWISDGTPTGTRRIVDLWPGSSSSVPNNFFEVNGKIGFEADVPGVDGAFWVTDGTAQGTTLVGDLNPTGDSNVRGIASTSAGTLMVADDGVAGAELWLSDGTTTGTSLLVNAHPDQVNANGVTSSLRRDDEYRGRRYFLGTTGTDGTELWETDGTAVGTKMVADFLPGPSSSQPAIVGQVNGGLLLTPRPVPFPMNAELHVFDPALGTTQLLKTFSITLVATGVSVDGTVYFPANDGSGNQLWQSDGTVTGTVPVPGSPRYPLLGNLFPRAVLDGYVYYTSFEGSTGEELWRTNGNGSEFVADVEPGFSGSFPEPVFAIDGRMLFVATTSATGNELWSTDGTAQGTQLVADLWLGPAGSNPQSFAALGDRVIFWANDGTLGAEFFVTDGTPSGTNLLLQIPHNGFQFSTFDIVIAGETAFISAFDGNDEYGIWKTDGTPGNTSLVVGALPYAPRIYAIGNGHIAYRMESSSLGAELWVSDGTPSGTRLVADSRAGGQTSTPRLPVRVGNQVLFTADDGVTGHELHAVPLTHFGGWVAEAFGDGCGASMSTVGKARLTETLGLVVESSGLSAPAALYYGVSPAYLALAQNCEFNLGGAIFVAVTATDATGRGQIDVPFPDDPSITGIPLHFEYIVAVPGGPFAGVAELSDGLEIIVGS